MTPWCIVVVVVVGVGWCGGCRRLKGGDGLVPPGVAGVGVHGDICCGGCCGVGQLPWLAAHFLARLPGPPPQRSELLLG